MPIAFQNGGQMIPVARPWIKLGDNNWYSAKTVSVLTGGGWKEVWPYTKTYIHTGVGYQMNIAACFGWPSTPSNFIFINNGTIGGGSGAYALLTGGLPAGSTLTIINNGYIQGAGGWGGARMPTTYPPVPPEPGWPALGLQYPAVVQNNGYIWGGGGGGCAGIWMQRVGGGREIPDYQKLLGTGGGGAGLVPGPNGTGAQNENTYIGWDGQPGTQWSGGTGGTDNFGNQTGGSGGGPGLPGGSAWQAPLVAGATRTLVPGGAAGHAIDGAGYLISLTGNNGDQIRGGIY
jgi:hypothetical protein